MALHRFHPSRLMKSRVHDTGSALLSFMRSRTLLYAEKLFLVPYKLPPKFCQAPDTWIIMETGYLPSHRRVPRLGKATEVLKKGALLWKYSRWLLNMNPEGDHHH